MRIVRVVAALLASAGMVLVLGAANAAADSQTLSGSCQFSGPIHPNPPITVTPVPGAHFSYEGTGTCSGTFDGHSTNSAMTVTFTNVATAFDTCEFGPDFDLPGTMSVEANGVTADFAITINLARLALVGPFTLTTPGGGEAAGRAEFTPPDEATAVQQCASSGIGTATLSGSFHTLSSLMGTEVTAVTVGRPRMAVKWRRRRTARMRHRRTSA